MKRRLFFLLLIIFSINFAYAEVRINEVELNPAGTDNNNEWIEIYSTTQAEFINWKISSSNGRNITFNASFEEYYVLNTPYNFLTNGANNLTLQNENGTLIYSTKSLTDNTNNDYSWQYCTENWIFTNSSKGIENNCIERVNKSVITNNTNSSYSDKTQTNNSTKTSLNNSKVEISSLQINKNPAINNSNQNNIQEVIILGKTPAATENTIPIENSIIYKSKNEYIKEYTPYAFSALCIFIMILLIIQNKNDRKQDD